MRLWERFGRVSGQFIGVSLLLGALSASAFASNVQFVGSVGRSSDYATFAILHVDQIRNFDTTGTSANLRVELWASVQPFSGSYTSAYRLVAYSVGPLAAGASTPTFDQVVTPFSQPPYATYHFAMVLTEYTGGPSNDGYTIRNYIKFPNTDTLTFGIKSTDTTPPTVSITSPTGGNVSGTVTVSANASDNVGVTRVEFYINGVLVGTDTSAPYQYTWNTTAFPNGAATLYAKAFDAKPNSAQSSTVNVTVANVVQPPPDTTPPTVSITSPTGGNVSGTVTVSANASDNVGVTRVEFYINGVLVGTDTSAPYQYTWNTTAFPNGAATLYAKAFDAKPNSAQSSTVNVTVANVVQPPPDTTPPTVSITSPTGGNVSGTVTVSANASDNVGVTRVEFYINGVLVGTDTSAPYQYTWNTTAFPNGAATLYAKAFDAKPNSAQSSTVNVTVANVVQPPPDTTPPTVSITSPTGGNVSGTVTVSANASDNVGVTRVEFYINGVLVGTDTLSPYQFLWRSTSVPNGAAQLKTVAYDAAGNLAQSAIVAVTVANFGGPPPGAMATSYAIEYYNAPLDHYFISASATDINALDSGKFSGWARTGNAFKVFTDPASNASPVCRFYIPPVVGDSHFYSASPTECAEAVVRFPIFIEESESVFYVDLPDPITGACPADRVPVYRVWNTRADSNHRYMTDRSLRDQMVAKGYIAEGYGPDAVIMCAPM